MLINSKISGQTINRDSSTGNLSYKENESLHFKSLVILGVKNQQKSVTNPEVDEK